MRILIVDNTIDVESRGSQDLCRLARVLPGATIIVRRAPEQDLPSSPRGFDRVILSGSKTSSLADAPWISKLHEFVRQSLSENIPYLGVCYGHQTLARVLGGKPACRVAQRPEIGWTKIEVTGESPLFKGIPSTFYSFSSHYEEVGELPSGLRHFARSEDCAIQAFQIPGKPVFGIQFHPERDVAGAERVLSLRKKSSDRKLLLQPHRSEELYDASIGETILKNFLEANQ